MEFRVLGTIEVAGNSPPGAKERAILARLLLDPGRTVPADALLEAVWEGVPRDVAARSLAVRVANLRAFLEPGRARGAPSSLLVRDGAGYRLAVAPGQVDAERFERCVRTAAGLPPAAALELLDNALALWRGTPFGELAEAEFAIGEVRRLEGLHSQAEETRARALVELGRPLEAIDDLRRLVAADPLREELVATLMLALYAAGRQVEALAAYRELAGRLRELGLAPGAATRALEQRILEHDATLAAPSAAPAGPAQPVAPAGREPELARLRAALARALAGRRAGVLHGASPASASPRSSTRSCARRPPARRPASGSASPSAGRASRTCPCSTRSASWRAARPARRSSPHWRQRAPTWLVELPWLLGEDAGAEAVAQRAQGATRARMLREMLEALEAICAERAARARARGPALGRRLDARPARRAAAPPRARAAAVLGTYRAEGAAPVVELAHELSVRGLARRWRSAGWRRRRSRRTSRRAFRPAPLPGGFVDVLRDRSGGNPLFSATCSTTGSPKARGRARAARSS